MTRVFCITLHCLSLYFRTHNEVIFRALKDFLYGLAMVQEPVQGLIEAQKSDPPSSNAKKSFVGAVQSTDSERNQLVVFSSLRSGWTQTCRWASCRNGPCKLFYPTQLRQHGTTKCACISMMTDLGEPASLKIVAT